MTELLAIAGLAYGAANIGLLTAIYFRLGKHCEKLDHYDDRLKRLEGRLALVKGD